LFSGPQNTNALSAENVEFFKVQPGGT